MDFPEDSVAIIAFENKSSISWLQDYANSRAITYPLVYDPVSEVFDLYQVGHTYGNVHPSYIIIDQEGVVQFRIDTEFERFSDMKDKIEELLDR